MSAAVPLDVGRSLVSGGAWMVALRWALRGLGLVNTFILARLLAPSDFGLVAMAMVVIGLVEMLGQTGQLLALIRHPAPTRAHYDSVWTLSILIAIALTAMMWAAAPLAVLYFHEPRAGELIKILALRTLVGGFTNVGVVAFRKELRFGREFLFQVAQRLLTMLATIACALILRDWRALVVGILGGQVLGVGLSYVMHPYRPRFAVNKISEMLGFSGWMLAVNVAQYVTGKADEFVVGGVASPTAMGLYNVAADTATAPTMEVALPVVRALFPIFARIADDAVAVRAAYLEVFAATCMISVAVGGGMALVAADFVAVALGPKWITAVPLVRILAIAGGLYGLMQAGIPVLNATGHSRLSAQVTASRALAMVLAMGMAAWWGDIATIAWVRTVVTAAFIPGIFIAIARVLPVTIGDMLARAWRPVAAGMAMIAAVLAAHAGMPPAPLARLFVDTAVGAVAYGGAVLLLWWLAGRPAGLEAAVVRQILPRRVLLRG